MPRPYVLKPVNEGSSVGVAIVTRGGNYGDPIGADTKGPWQDFDRLLAEPFIRAASSPSRCSATRRWR
jgi:D-alanine-D-alanine ligase